MNVAHTSTKDRLDRERNKLVWRLEKKLEIPLAILGFVWLVLLVIELTEGLNETLETASIIIWIIFILDFIIKFIIAPRKISYLKKNVITVLSLLVPAFRMFRIVSALRFLRSLDLVKVVGSLNRGINALSRTMERRAFGYVLIVTLVVLFTGAAGMYAFERGEGKGFQTYSESLWWTAMLLTTIGSEAWPHTPEGRALCVILSLFSFGVLGYFTATLATFFVGQDAGNKNAELAGAKEVKELKSEISALRKELGSFLQDQYRNDQ